MAILEEIIERRRERLAQEQASLPQEEIEARLRDLEDRPRDFARMLQGEKVRVIAEIKRRSPSQGRLAELVDPRTLAQDYAGSGAAALSVLTEQDYFDGEPHFVRRARQLMPLPVLRKDFIIDKYQVYESRLLLADALLLIVRALTPSQLQDYLALTRELGMEALVETHEGAEIERALAAGARVIGINNRNLDTLEVSLAVTEKLAALVPLENVLVSESGIHSAAEVERLAAAGVEAILVGTALMKAEDPGQALRPLTQVPAQRQRRAD